MAIILLSSCTKSARALIKKAADNSITPFSSAKLAHDFPRVAGRYKLKINRLVIRKNEFSADFSAMQANSETAAVGAALLASFQHTFQQYKTLADRALAQLEPAEWLHRPAPGNNSAAVIVQHLVGNLRSRFTDFLTTDGEKPTRHREAEFDEPATTEAVPALQADWQQAWQVLFDLLATLKPSDLLRTVTIRGEAHTVLLALQRQVAHYSMHVGQLVQLAKIIRGESFHSLSIPRGQSDAFNAAMQDGKQ